MSRLSIAGAAFIAAALIAPGPLFAMGLDASSPEEQVGDAVSAIKKQDYNAAIEALDKALDADSRNADALNYMGYSYRKLGQYDKAVDYYLKALAVDPDHKGALEYLGEAYLEIDQPAKAEANLRKLAELCNSECEEYRELKKAIDAFKTGTGSKS